MFDRASAIQMLQDRASRADLDRRIVEVILFDASPELSKIAGELLAQLCNAWRVETDAATLHAHLVGELADMQAAIEEFSRLQ